MQFIWADDTQTSIWSQKPTGACDKDYAKKQEEAGMLTQAGQCHIPKIETEDEERKPEKIRSIKCSKIQLQDNKPYK